MHDSTRADSTAGMAGMDHSAMGHAHADGTAAAGTDHSAHGGSAGRPSSGAAHAGGHGRASTGGASAGHAGMNHATPRTSSAAAHAGHTAESRGTTHAGTNHNRGTEVSNAHGSHAATGGQSQTAAYASGTTAAAGSHAGHEKRTAGAASHAGAHAAGGAANAHAGMNHGASGHAMQTTASRPVDEGTRKLLDLAGELVRDPAVQREIQQDPALRDAWSDPAVRRVVTKQP